MKQAKCTSCGANIVVDENQDAGVCPFCNTAYVTDKVIKEHYNSNNTTNTAGTIVNNYYTTQTNDVVRKTLTTIPPRPQINILLAILGFIFYIFPGVIYVSSVMQKQKEWDSKYAGKK